MEPVYSTVITTARLLWLAEGLKFSISGVENVPKSGPGVVAINHTGYLDFTYAGIPAYLQGKRYVRFMAKKESSTTGTRARSCGAQAHSRRPGQRGAELSRRRQLSQER